jgi:hypothetical protein
MLQLERGTKFNQINQESKLTQQLQRTAYTILSQMLSIHFLQVSIAISAKYGREDMMK